MSQAPLAAQAPPVTIESMEMRELAPGAEVTVIADGPLVWTQYRDAEGNLVVELPNTVIGPSVEGVLSEEGLVASIEVSSKENGTRPLTSMTVRTREDAEHALTVDGKVLQLQLLPAELEDSGVLAFEPLPKEPAPMPAQSEAELEPVLEQQADVAGTVEEPYLAPPPQGVPATQLHGVEILAADDVTVVRVNGDGEFAFSTFQLENPERFVVDLSGVINTSSHSTVAVDSAVVERVRLAQFRPHPEPVSRVVFDLRDKAAPAIERVPDGLIVRFGAGVAALSTLAQDLSVVEAPVEPAAEAAVAGEEEPEWSELEEPVYEDLPAGEEIAEGPAETAAQAELVYEEMEPAAESVAETPQPPMEPIGEAPTTAVAEELEEPLPAPILPTTDVALFEAQELQVEQPEEREEGMLRTFGSQMVGGAEPEYFGEPISMSLRDADIREVLRSIARISGLNIVIQPGVSGLVTVELDRIPWDQALDLILRVNNLGMELEGTVLRIAPVQQLRDEAVRRQELLQAQALSIPLSTVIKRLSYANANEVARILTSGRRGTVAGFSSGGVMSQRGAVTVDNRTNTLIIKELPDFLNTVLAVIDQLDIPEPQVMIEARIVETAKEFSRTLGIEWTFSGVSSPATGNTTGLEFPNNGTLDGGVQLLTGGANGFLDVAMGNVLNTFNLNARLQAAESEGLVNVISAPKVATMNNERATIQSGLQIPIQTVANNTVTVQFVNATLRLEVTPHVTAEGTVLMEINIQKREPRLDLAVVGATNAPISTQEARTRVIVRDGGTTVIGGIYEVTTDQGSDRVPGLANIPVLGALFKNKRRNDSNDELLIFITPRIVRL